MKKKRYSIWQVAAAVLAYENRSMHYDNLTDKIIHSGLSELSRSENIYPEESVSSRLYENRSIFKALGNGWFKLKEPEQVLNNGDVKEAFNLIQDQKGKKEIQEASKKDIEAFEKENSLIAFEGELKEVYSSYYERKPELRRKAIEIHGTKCMVKSCGFDFQVVYGERGRNFIEVHHLKPLSNFKGEEPVEPKQDMAVVCSNCHRIIHRRQNQVLSLDEVDRLIKTHSLV